MKHDPAGIWFEAFKALGEPSDILFDFRVEDANTSVKHIYPHAKGDATAAMNEIAKQYRITLQKVGEKKKPQPITFKSYLKQIILFNYYARPRWQKLWPFEVVKSTQLQTPYAYLALDRTEVAAVKARAEKIGISLNTLLFYTLNQATREYLKPVRQDLTWIVPVNFRSDFDLPPNAEGNLAANFTCKVSTESPQELQKKISYLLRTKRHWGVWFWMQMSRWMPFFLVKFLTHLRLQPNYNAGVFTNLGEWHSPTEFSHFTFFANPIISHPIVASSLELNGQLTIGLRLYPSFPLTQSQLNEYLKLWKSYLFTS